MMTRRANPVALEDIAGLNPADAACLLRRGDDAPARLMELVESAERLVIAELKRALDLTEMLVRLADELGDPLPRARARRAWAQALAYANRFDDALVALGEATGLAETAGAGVEAARARLTTLHALARQGRYDEAIAAGESARSAFVEAGERVLAARADINLGVTQRMRDRPAEALRHFDRARAALDDQPLLLAPLQSNRAEALLDLNRFEEAELAFEAAREQFERAGAARAVAIVEGNLADLAGRQGRLDRALEHFERAVRRLDESEAPGDLARLEAERADALGAIGMHAEAAEAYRRALPVLREMKMAWETARALAGLGRELAAMGRPEDAEPQLAAAAAAFEALGHSTGLGRVRISQAAAARQPDEAARLLRLARELLADRPADAAAADLGLSSLDLRAGRLDEAESRAHEALRRARELDLAPLIADLLHALARIARARGKPGEALRRLREAVAEVERVRGTLSADRFGSAYLGGRTAIYEDAVSAVLDGGGEEAAAEAFSLVERAKSRSLLDLMHGGAAIAESLERGAENPDEAKLLAAAAKMHADLNALYAQLDDPAGRAGRDPAAWKQTVHERERSLADLERRLAATRRYGRVYGQPAGLAQAAAVLNPDAGLLEFFVEGGRYAAVLATRNQARVFRGLATREDVADRVESLYFQVGRAIARGLPAGPAGERLAAAATAETDRLYDLLLAPMQEAIEPLRRLIVIPHGVLHAAPMHALSRRGEPLVAQREVLQAPSASVLTRMTQRPAGSEPARRVVVGVSDELIPYAEREACAVAERITAATRLIGREATTQRVKEALRGAGAIHIAAHARFIHENPMASGIKLADGWLTARELCALRLEGAAVTLSGCDTGRSALTAGEELMGLTRAFLLAGARSLLLTLWPAHDRHASDFMLAVCEARYDDAGREVTDTESSGGLAGAVRQSQLALRERQGHLAAWGPYVLIGAN